MHKTLYVCRAQQSQNYIIQVQVQRRIAFLLLAGILFQGKVFAQKKDSSNFKFGGYVDAYYALYTDSAGTNNYQKFPVISPKSNAFGLNIIQLTGQYNSKKLRAIATIHYGDIPTSAWSSVLNLVQEANFGIRVTKKIWVDAGLFKTHIGTEALLPKDNIASTLSIITFYEPWFQAGVKLSYLPNDKLTVCLHVLNGYNTFVENNKKKSIGLAVSYLLGEKGSIGYYNLYGDDTPDSIHLSHVRFLHNLVFTYQLTNKLKILVGADLISQQHSAITNAKKTAFAYGAITTLKYQFKPKFGAYIRGEMFNDEDGFLTGVITDANNELTGFKLWGITAGLEYKPTENSFIRLEGRQLQMNKDQEIFRWKGENKSQRFEMMLHGGVWF